MVILENKDRCIANLEEKIIDIVHEYISTNKVYITTNYEGLCLDAANFYSVLDYACDKFQIDKKAVTIYTCNAEESHPEYNIQISGNHWIEECKPVFQTPIPAKKEILKTAGCFLGKPNWHRLILASWLHTNYHDKIQLTCHYDQTQEIHAAESELTIINQLAPEELSLVIPFLKKCPILLDEGFLNYPIGPAVHYNILSKYPDIFLELTVETYVSGRSFFPTEKTLRPIIAKTPFIIMGPQGHLSNMQRIGFRTFSQWWSEDYDNFSKYQRIVEIKKILTEIFSWSTDKLHRTLDEMSEVLDHNRLLLQNMTSEAVILSHEK